MVRFMELGIILQMLVCGMVYTGNPGFVVHLTEKGLSLISAFARDSLKKYMDSGRTTALAGARGHLKYELHTVAVKDYDSGYDVDIGFIPTKSIALRIKDLSVTLESPYKVSVWIFYNTGTVTADLYKFNADVVLGVSMVDGHLQPSVRNCEAFTNTLSIKFRGGLINKIMNLFKGKIAKKVKGMLSKQICEYIREKMAPELQKALFNVPLSTTLFNDYQLNYTMVANPSVTREFMESKHSGSIFATKKIKSEGGINKTLYDMVGASMVAPPFPSMDGIDGSAHMINLYLSQWTINTLFYYLKKYGALDNEFTKETMPEEYADFLDTECDLLCAGALYPELGRLFPRSSMDIRIAIAEPPRTHFRSGAINVTTVMNVTGFAREHGKRLDERKFVFSSLADAKVTMELNFVNQSIVGGLKFNGVKLHTFRSVIESITIGSFDPIMSYAIDDFIEPHFAQFLSEGIQIPKTGPFSFDNGKISPTNGILIFAANFKYEL